MGDKDIDILATVAAWIIVFLFYIVNRYKYSNSIFILLARFFILMFFFSMWFYFKHLASKIIKWEYYILGTIICFILAFFFNPKKKETNTK